MKEYKAGMKAKVIGNHSDHRFRIGEIVTLENKGQTLEDWKCIDSEKDYWWVMEDDLEIIEEPAPVPDNQELVELLVWYKDFSYAENLEQLKADCPNLFARNVENAQIWLKHRGITNPPSGTK